MAPVRFVNSPFSWSLYIFMYCSISVFFFLMGGCELRHFWVTVWRAKGSLGSPCLGPGRCFRAKWIMSGSGGCPCPSTLASVAVRSFSPLAMPPQHKWVNHGCWKGGGCNQQQNLRKCKWWLNHHEIIFWTPNEIHDIIKDGETESHREQLLNTGFFWNALGLDPHDVART